MKRSPIARKPMKKRGARLKPRNSARRKKNFARAYGGEARIRFVLSLPCVVGEKDGFGCHGVMEQMHIKTGGMGRKADARFVVPGCTRHHTAFHNWGGESFQRFYGVNLEAEAQRVDALWRELHPEAAA